MYILKNSIFPLALSSIVLFASVTPALCAKPALRRQKAAQRAAGHVRFAPTQQTAASQVQIPTESKKRKRTWQEKLRKQYREFKQGVAELLGDNPVRNVAAVIGGALALWFVWTKIANPWTHREAVVGQSACDIMEVVMPQGEQREITHHIVDQQPQLDPEALARGERIFIDGEANQRIVHNHYRLANPAHIVQLRCAYQDGPECAYHALKNCMIILNELTHPSQNGNLQQQLADYALSQRLFGFNEDAAHGVWRQRIFDERLADRIPAGECNEHGDWLRGAAVQNIIDHERRPADDAQRLLLDQNTPITIIEDARTIANPGNPEADPTQAARAGFALPGAYTHGFIFNTARTAINAHGVPVVPRRGKNGGHWMAAVLHRNANGEVRWYCANSTNGSMVRNEVLQDLIAAVQGARV